MVELNGVHFFTLVPVEHVCFTSDLVPFKFIWVIWCTCDFTEFSKSCFLYTYVSLLATPFIGVPCCLPHNSDFLAYINLKLEKKYKKFKI